MKYSDDYKPGLFTGTALAERLQTEGKAELMLRIAGVKRQPFQDADQQQWVLTFGPTEQELRVKLALGRPLFAEFGNDSDKWIGRHVALSAKPISWIDRDTGDTKEGITIVVRHFGQRRRTSDSNSRHACPRRRNSVQP